MANSKDVSNQVAKEGLGGGFWSSVVNGAVGLTNSFNYRAQENNIALAQINADAQKSANDADRAGKNSRTIIIVGVVIAVLIMAMMFAGKK